MLGGKWAKHKTTITSKTLYFFIYPPCTKSWHYYTSIIIITINNLLSRDQVKIKLKVESKKLK